MHIPIFGNKILIICVPHYLLLIITKLQVDSVPIYCLDNAQLPYTTFYKA